jgi:hypothetical protein
LTGHREAIFLGGAPHSGVELIAELLSRHPRLAPEPIAARFHSDDRGIPALLGGRIGVADFVADLRGQWWNGSWDEAALERFEGAYHADPLAACRELFWSLLDGDGGHPLVEASVGNLKQGQTLVRLFPEARFVHVVRDGRDAAAAALSAGEGGGLRMAIRRWADELRTIEEGVRGADDGSRYAIPTRGFGVVVLDRVATGDDEALRDLLALAGVEVDHETQAFRDERLTPEAIGRGRWRERARGAAGWAAAAIYRRELTALERERNHAARPLIEAYERIG